MTASADLAALVAELQEAGAVASRLGGGALLGVRAVEAADGDRRYLCALEGPRFLCLGPDHQPEPRIRRVRETASAALLCERALDEIDIGGLHAFATAAGALLARPELDAVVGSAVREMAAAALRLAAWAAAPERAIASVPAIDEAIRRHEAARNRYGAFVSATDPLVARQDGLPAELVAALRQVEEASGPAGLGLGLAGRLSDWIEDCDAGAADVVAAHVTPLDGD